MAKDNCKSPYREKYLKIRDSISAKDHQEKSVLASRHFLGLDEYKQANSIHIFVPYKSEVDTRSIIESAWQSGKIVVCPITDTKNHKLIHAQTKSWDDFTPGYAGILEPRDSCDEFPLADIDIIVVPAMAFDSFGYRMGYGGGYYDRFLGELKALKVSLAFSEQVFDAVPHCRHDLQIDILITDKTVSICKNDQHPLCPLMDIVESCPEK